MKNSIWILIIALIISSLNSTEGNAETFIRLKGLGWDSSITGKIQMNEGTSAGTYIDLKDTLGITDSSIVPEIEGKANLLGLSRYIISYTSASYEGKKMITKKLSFAGKTFETSETIKTQLDITMTSFLTEFVSPTEEVTSTIVPAIPEIGLLLGIKYLHINGKMTSNNTGAVAEDSFGFPFPVVGLRVQGVLSESGNLILESSATYMKLKSFDVGVKWSDISTEIRYNIIPRLHFGGGYKITKFGIESKRGQYIFTRLGFEGLYAVVSLEL
ncbi:MAG: hypothetical protein QME51_01665 [Planctomycetota bacterium]|nr:hypothetical protein [Planctomycetota bacterium]